MSAPNRDSGLPDEDEKKPKIPSSHINLKINVQNGDGVDLFIRIKRNTQLKKLMDACCEKQSLDINSVVFLLNGQKFRGDQTPDELKIEEGDEIDVMLHQNGGGI